MAAGLLWQQLCYGSSSAMAAALLWQFQICKKEKDAIIFNA